MSRWCSWLSMVLFLGLALPGSGQPPKEDPAHEELRAFRREIVEAINSNNLDKLLTLLDDEVVATFMNAEIARKPAGVKAYYERMMHGEQRIVKSIKIDPSVDELTHLYGNTGIATGNSKDTYELTDGRSFTIETRWTATLVKKDGHWKLAAFHDSGNVFDNPIMGIAIRQVAYWVGGITAGVALLLGVLLFLGLRRKKPAS